MEKVVLVFCKIENCYDGNEGYNNRKENLPQLFEKLEKIKNVSDADKVIFSLYTNDIYANQYIKPTEIFINLKENNSSIDICRNFYKDENHEVVNSLPAGNNYKIVLHDSNVTMGKEMVRFINESRHTYNISRTIFITDTESPIQLPGSDVVIAYGGLKSVIASLDEYINNIKIRRYNYA